MADRDECAAISLQPLLQPVDRGDVEVVGRLVEQQHVRVLRQCPHDRGPAALATARADRRARQIDADPARDRIRLMGGRSIVAAENEIAQAGVTGHRRLLLEQNDARARANGAAPLIRFQLPGDQAQQSGLAGAVAADQRQPVALTDVHVEVAEQPTCALVQAKSLI